MEQDVIEDATRTPPNEAAPDAPPAFLFSETVRRRAVIGVVAHGLIHTVIAIVFIRGERAVLTVWPMAGAPLLVSLVALGLAARRSSAAQAGFWRLWMAGTAFAGLTGISIMIAGIWPGVIEVRPALAVCYLVSILATVFWLAAVAQELRSKSGRRTFGVDLLDFFIVFIAVSAPGFVVVLQRASQSPHAVFIVPCTVAACVLAASVLPVALIYARLPRHERFVPGMFLTLTCWSVINALLLIAMGLSGFTMNPGPLIAAQAVDMGLMLLLPLFARHQSSAGLGRLTVQDQVRRPGLGLALLLAAVPVMVAEALILPEARDWVVPLSVGALGLFVCLVGVRYVLVMHETKRLYHDLEHLADERHQLLSSLLRAAEGESHRVAVQLHEEALSTLVMVGAVAGHATTSVDGGAATMDLALSKVREDLSVRVDSLRRLMLAVHTPDHDEQSLATALKVWCHDLIGDRATAVATIDVDPELVLDWTTRTIVYRIAQEAIRHAWRQGGATSIEVHVRWQNPALVVEIVDNGRPPDPGNVMYGSALDTMRVFANLGRGSVEVERGEGHTRVLALLGVVDEPSPAPATPGSGRRDRPDVDAAPAGRGGLRLVTDR